MIPIILVCASLWTGCSFSRGTIGDEFMNDNIAAVKKGASTRADVVTALGAPDRIMQAGGQEIFQYYRYDLKAGSLFLALVNFSRFNIKSDDLYVFFNRDGVVDDLVYGRRTDRLKFQFWPFGD
jgi:outer membrane protein assembly factor BamE (lipoprotein component of BamABCDE complex)